MESIKLYKSNICRLCAEENENATELFPINNDDDNSVQNLSELINKYLPIKVENDGKLPVKICPGCHIQLEATKIFMDLIVEGQTKLRELFKAEQATLQRIEKQRQQLEDALHHVNPTSKVNTYTIQSDETGEQFLIQIFSDGPLFPPDHELSLRAEGLERPKRKRGRPPKPAVSTSAEKVGEDQESEETEPEAVLEQQENEVEEIDGRRRRRIKAPSRYRGEVQGKELDKILQEEGLTDDEESIKRPKADANAIIETVESANTVEGDEGQFLGDLLVMNKKKSPKPGILRKRKKYECKTCKKTFLHFGRFILHKRSRNCNSNTEIYKCNETDCNFTSNDEKSAEQHKLESQHAVLKITDQFPNNNDSDNKSDERPKFQCESCGKAFASKQNYATHCRAIHKLEKPFKCSDCDKEFSYHNCLKIHKLSHSTSDSSAGGDERHYACEQCDKIFLHPSSLIYHRDAAHNESQFACGICNKVFKHRQLLQRHQLVHTDERPFKCAVCQSAFKSKANLLSHETLHYGIRKYVCSKCGQTFAHKTSLTLHLRWHAGLRPYQCDICKKNFSQKGNLMEHKRIHTGEKPYQCTHCGRSFTTSSQFKLHTKRHTGEKPWQCEFCSKSFLHKDTWKAHTRRHLNDRPFKCALCQRGFTESWALKKHERLHTGEKPYSCDECGRGFADSSNLTKHRRTHGVKNLIITEKTADVEEEQSEIMNLRQLIDQHGNPITITINDGQQVPIVTQGGENDNIQGLLPDGSLVPIDITTIEDKSSSLPDLEEQATIILNSDIQFLQTNNVNETVEEQQIETSEKAITVHQDQSNLENIPFLTATNDNGQVFLITSSSASTENASEAIDENIYDSTII